MMIKNYKKIGFLAGAIFLTGSQAALAVPLGNRLNVSTENQNQGQEKREEIRTEMQAKMCERLGGFISKMDERISQGENKVQNRHQERLTNWEDRQNEVEANLAQFRNQRDTNIEAHFKALEERVKTEEQKKAVANFEETVQKAIETRRNAVDAAMDDFRDGVKKAIDSKQGAVDTAMADFKNAKSAALEKAKSDCDKGVAPATVRQNLRASLGLARQKFQTSRQNSEKVGTTVTALVATRKQAVEKALAEFKASMTQARTELKKSFPTDDNTPTTENEVK